MKLTFEKGKPPFDTPYIPLGDDTSLEWVSYGDRRYPDYVENFIMVVKRSDKDPTPGKGYRKVKTFVKKKVGSKRKFSDDVKVHQKFFDTYLSKPEIRRDIVKQVLNGEYDEF